MPKRRIDECDLQSAFGRAPLVGATATELSDDDSDCSLMTGECSEDGSLETEGSTETPDVPSTDMYTALKKKPGKKSVNFDDVTVYYFPRVQGFTCVPSQGGSTLGMGDRHTSVEKYSLADYARLRRSVHRDILLEHHREGKILLPENFSDPSAEFTFDEYYFLQPVPARQRRALLHEAGVAEIDPTERDECRNIRASRGRCGCTCREVCQPATCACHRSGIRCQVDQMSFPCACSRDGCLNPYGRVEFNAARVRAHFVRTLLQMEVEQDQAAIGSDEGSPVLKRARLMEQVHQMTRGADVLEVEKLPVGTVAVPEGILPSADLPESGLPIYYNSCGAEDVQSQVVGFEPDYDEYEGSESSSEDASLENEVAEFSEHDMLVYDGRQSPTDGHFLGHEHRPPTAVMHLAPFVSEECSIPRSASSSEVASSASESVGIMDDLPVGDQTANANNDTLIPADVDNSASVLNYTVVLPVSSDINYFATSLAANSGAVNYAAGLPVTASARVIESGCEKAVQENDNAPANENTKKVAVNAPGKENAKNVAFSVSVNEKASEMADETLVNEESEDMVVRAPFEEMLKVVGVNVSENEKAEEVVAKASVDEMAGEMANNSHISAKSEGVSVGVLIEQKVEQIAVDVSGNGMVGKVTYDVLETEKADDVADNSPIIQKPNGVADNAPALSLYSGDVIDILGLSSQPATSTCSPNPTSTDGHADVVGSDPVTACLPDSASELKDSTLLLT